MISQRNKKLRGAIMVVFAGIFWGFSGTCGQLLSQDLGVPVQWIAAQRMGWSALFFLVVGLLLDRKNIATLLKDREALIRVVVYALLGVICCQWFYLEAINATNAGTATLMEQIGLIIVVAVTCWKERRSPHKFEIAGLILALIGVFFVTTHGNPTVLVMPLNGLLWGIAACFGAAFYILLPVELLKRWGSLTVTAPAMVIAGIIAQPVFSPWTFDVTLTTPVVLATAGMVICGTILAYTFFMQGVRDAGPVLAGLLNTIELVAAFVISVVWLHTSFTVWDIVGCVFIMGMMVMITLEDAKSAKL